jgi:HPt (histidine-containing phosphotransfer) domain-containing protein
MSSQTLVDEMNADALYGTAAGDPDIAPCLPQFIAALPEYVRNIERLLRMRALDEIREVIHQIKGIGGVYGFAPLSEAAGRAEKALTDFGLADRIVPDIEALIRLIRRVDGYCPAKERIFPGRKQQ